MTLTTTQLVDVLKKRIKILIAFVIILFLIIIYILYQVNNNSGGKMFRTELDEPIAIENVKKFRAWPRSTRNSSYGVIYDVKDIRKYIDTIYPDIINRLSKDGSGTPPPGYVWKVGFYWMMAKDSFDNKTKRDFCVMPILVRETRAKAGEENVADYFKKGDTTYNHEHTNTTSAGVGKGNAYDNGQMWP